MDLSDSSRNGTWIQDAIGRFEGPLVQYAARMVGGLERARDVVQETLLKLCEQNRDEVEPHLAEWLYTVCRNKAIDIRRKESRMILLETNHIHERTATQPLPLDQMVQGEESAGVLQLLDSLPENQQEVLRLKFQSSLSYREIASITGHSISNVGFLIHTALKTLRSRMGDSG